MEWIYIRRIQIAPSTEQNLAQLYTEQVKHFQIFHGLVFRIFFVFVLFLAIFQWYEQVSETEGEQKKQSTTIREMMKNCSSNNRGGKWKSFSHFSSAVNFVVWFRLAASLPDTRHFLDQKFDIIPPQEEGIVTTGKNVNDASGSIQYNQQLIKYEFADGEHSFFSHIDSYLYTALTETHRNYIKIFAQHD